MTIDLSQIDVIINQCKPYTTSGELRHERNGASLFTRGQRNQECFNVLFRKIHSFIGDVYLDCVQRLIDRGATHTDGLELYNHWKQCNSLAPTEIIALFQNLGVEDIFDGFSWQGQSTSLLKYNLNKMEQINQKLDTLSRDLSSQDSCPVKLSEIKSWKSIAKTFSERFPAHVYRNFL